MLASWRILLGTGMLRPVYHGENGLRTLRELAHSYQTIGKDLTRVMNRLKALYRGWGISCAGTQVYAACSPSQPDSNGLEGEAEECVLGVKHATTDPADHLGRRNPGNRSKKIAYK
jgi:hypothetical protein